MEQIPQQNEIHIEKMGSYFESDDEGYLINPASTEKIQSEFKEAIDDVTNLYKDVYGDKLVSVYIRGSVAKGEAIKDVSDLDTYAIVNLGKEEIDNTWIDKAETELMEKYSSISGFELGADPIDEPDHHRNIMLNQSVCVWRTFSCRESKDRQRIICSCKKHR